MQDVMQAKTKKVKWAVLWHSAIFSISVYLDTVHFNILNKDIDTGLV